MNKSFIVRLSVEERAQLELLVVKGNTAERELIRSGILLKADCSSPGPACSDQQISDALDLGVITVHRVRRWSVESGLDGPSSVVPHRVVRKCSTASKRPT